MQRRGVAASKQQSDKNDDYDDNAASTSAPPHRNVFLRHYAVVADTATATKSSSSPLTATRKQNDRRNDFYPYRLSGGTTTVCRGNHERCSPLACLIWIAVVFTAVIALLWSTLWIYMPASTTLLPLMNRRRPHSLLLRSTSTTLLVPASKPTLTVDTTRKLPSAAVATVTAVAAPRLKRHVDAETAVPVKADDVLDLRQLVYELPFDNVDGGVWKQGWDVQPISNTSMLRIVVVPFSNCDPGRTLTLDYDYIEARKVLDTIVNSLLNDKRRTFIWPQINLLAQWWQHQDDDMRCDVRELLRNGQLELVSGGWTTPDEAVTTRYALEQQLQLGHDWIQTNLGAENLPRTAWSVPTLSGHSPTLAYLYQKYNVTTGIALYRVHYAIKKKLAQSRQLEFYWRISSGDGQRQQQQQQQQRNPHNDLWTHVMPFYTHDIPHTCGPNPETCCRFDFGRNSVGPCPWPAQPVLVNDDNVVEQAHMLLDQYRRKAALYRSHTLLVPLGGDYRYGTPDEAELQLLQYQRLFDYMNQFWKRTITERFVSESSTATVLDFHYDAHVKAVDQEWLVQFSTNITNSGYFHTDLNGLHFDTHRYRKDMPIQSQIFPMSTWASIHDQKRRFSVLSDHSKGVASLQEGAIDVWLDRGLKRDGSLSGNGVPALRSLIQLRLVLERGAYDYDLDGDFEAARFCRQMVQEVQAPLILFGKRRSLVSPYLLNAQKQFILNKARVDQIKLEAQAKAPARVGMDVVRNVTSTAHAVDTAIIPLVFMVYKRDAYLKCAIIISHDGRVPAMIEYVESLKKDFNVIQLFACYDHPDTFPGNDPKLNEIYEGDVHGSPRLFEVSCCKHHFTWLMATVFTNTNFTRDNVNTFLFLEEDYAVSPVIYQGLVNVLNVMDQFAHETNGGFLGLSLDPSADRYIQQLGEDLGPGEWFASAFKSGPMTMHRSTFAQLQRGGGSGAAYYCGIDGFDEYNWDWSLVHAQRQFLIPHTVLVPSKVLAEHIGIEGGMHNHIHRDNSAPAATSFLGLTVRGSVWQDPRVFSSGFGGWGHPADQEQCMRLLSHEYRFDASPPTKQ